MLPTTQYPGRECVNWQTNQPDTEEAYGQSRGHLVSFPNLRGQIALRLGELFITIGKKLVTEGQASPRLSEETV